MRDENEAAIPPPRSAAPVDPAPDEPAFDLIELLFFAYRDFVGEIDKELAADGLGRAHHRVLHFVARQPGLPVADLLVTLAITKQSLNRVLKDLVGRGFVEQRTGTVDRRQRLLHPTARGRDLARRLAAIQTGRIEAALAGTEPGLRAGLGAFLLGMVDAPARDEVRRRTGAATMPR